MWLDYCSWRWFSDFGKFESCQEGKWDSVLGSSGTWVVVFADFGGYPGFGLKRCGNGLLWRSQHWLLYQRYDLVARPEPKKIQKLTWVCGSLWQTAHSCRCDGFQGYVEGPYPNTHGCFWTFFRFGSCTRTELARKCEKIVNVFVWLLGGSPTVALCRNFEFFRPVKPVSEAQELLNHVIYLFLFFFYYYSQTQLVK